MSQATLPPLRSAARSDSSLQELVADLRHRIEDSSRRWKLLILLEGIALAVTLPLAYLWTFFALDNLFYLPLLGRLLVSLGFVAVVAWVGVNFKRRWQNLRLSEDQVALAMEKETPGGVQNRLINAVQIARNPREGELNEEVVRENYERLQRMQLEQAAKVRPMMMARLGVAGALILFGLGFWVLLPDQFNNAAARIFLPLADIAPLYRTVLKVEPGDVRTSGNVTLTIRIERGQPETLTVFKNVGGKRTAEVLAVPPGEKSVEYTLRNLDSSLDYAVRADDFTSPYYHIELVRGVALNRLRVTMQYPAYTGLAEKTVESVGGELEAVQGTRANVTFVFDQPLAGADLVLERPLSSAKRTDKSSLTSVGERELSGEIIFDNVASYRLEIPQDDGPPVVCGRYNIRVLQDQEPRLELTGLERRSEMQLDSVLPVKVSASDDYGLDEVGLFIRKISGNQEVESNWEPIATWSGQRKTAFQQSLDFRASALKASEGDKVEVAVRGRDTDPARKGRWITGTVYEVQIGGEGVALQLEYEQILRSEAALQAAIKTQQEIQTVSADWLAKLSGKDNLRWDDPKNVDALHAAVLELGKRQEALRKSTEKLATQITAKAGNVPTAVHLLANTEMLRIFRILDSVATRDTPQAKRTAMADARLTEERTLGSLTKLLEQYQAFRVDWEMAHVIPFAKLLAERQTKLRDQSKQMKLVEAKLSEQNAAARESASRRQTKLIDLVKLVQPAYPRVAERVNEFEPTLAAAFRAASSKLLSAEIQGPMSQAAAKIQAGNWQEASLQQDDAAKKLTALYESLRQAQITAAQLALAALKDRAKKELDAQKEIEKLPPGTAEKYVYDMPEKFKVEDTIRIREVTGAKKSTNDPNEEQDLSKAKILDIDPKILDKKKDGMQQDPELLRLGTSAEKTPTLPMYAAKEQNKVKPFMQEKFDDLVGKLLDEADELSKKYQSIQLVTNLKVNEMGDSGKVGGSIGTTAASAPTGNKKPPLTESGGASRTGRQGARAYGLVADDDGVDRKGRDEPLEGKLQAPDQDGIQKLSKSEESGGKTSTGIGGKKVESDETSFSLSDSGKWKDDMAKRMEKPQKKQLIVERQGDKMDAKIAALLRDTGSKQEQVIERLKAIRKELKNLYLPTDHLDELAANLQANLDNLKDRPDEDLFKLQVQALDKLRGALRVFRTANSGFQPSLPRDQVIRGRVLDEPAAPALPGYDEAVKHYYKKLATQ